VRRSREKWSESAILKILSPVRLPFRHTGNIDLQAGSEYLKLAAEPCAALCALSWCGCIEDSAMQGNSGISRTGDGNGPNTHGLTFANVLDGRKLPIRRFSVRGHIGSLPIHRR
jgi:hypothetical protein